MKIHLAIYVSNMKLYHKDLTRNQPTREAVKANQKSSRKSEEILAKRKVMLSRRHRIPMKWKNLGDDKTNWKTIDDLKKLLQKIKYHDTRLSRR